MKLLLLSILFFLGIPFQDPTPVAPKTELLKKQISVYAEGKKRSIGYYEFHPADYKTGKHPAIIYLHGIGERGLNLAKTGTDTSTISPLLKQPIPKFLLKGSMKFTAGTKDYSFVVVAPQLSSDMSIWKPFYVAEMLKQLKKDTSVDQTRIYLTGMSLGGGGVHDALEIDSIVKQIAAASIVCGTCRLNSATAIVKYRLPVWLYHAKNDPTVSYLCTEKALALIKATDSTMIVRRTLFFDGGHGIWYRAYDTLNPAYKQWDGRVFRMNPNMFQWFLRYKRLPLK